jgi:integrase
MSAPKSFQIYEKRHASGNVGYRVDLGLVNGKRAFKHFPTREKAEAGRKRLQREQAAKNPLLLADIDASTRHEVLLALERLKDYRATITEAVNFFLKHARPAKADASIGQVMDQFKSVKTKAGLSAKYLDTAWWSFFVPFRDAFKNCLITDVTSEAVEKYIYKHEDWNSTTRATVIRHLSVLFNFAIDRGYATLNPLSSIQKPKRAANNSRDKVMTVEQVIQLLQYAYKNGYRAECAALVLILFCGVRVDEVRHVKWEDIKLDEETPVVVLDETKANRRRVNPIPKNAQDWLKELRAKGKLTPANYEGRMRYLRKKCPSGYMQNSARINFASYHVAKHEDPAKTSLLLGHQNPALLWNTYRALVTKGEAERYWKITPDYTDDGIKAAPPSVEQIQGRRAKTLQAALNR